MKTLKEQIAVMQAADDGADIESIYCGYDDWSIAPVQLWNWMTYDYRVAKPKPREFWRNYYSNDPLTFDHASKQVADRFSKIDRTECAHFREVLEDE